MVRDQRVAAASNRARGQASGAESSQLGKLGLEERRRSLGTSIAKVRDFYQILSGLISPDGYVACELRSVLDARRAGFVPSTPIRLSKKAQKELALVCRQQLDGHLLTVDEMLEVARVLHRKAVEKVQRMIKNEVCELKDAEKARTDREAAADRAITQIREIFKPDLSRGAQAR